MSMEVVKFLYRTFDFDNALGIAVGIGTLGVPLFVSYFVRLLGAIRWKHRQRLNKPAGLELAIINRAKKRDKKQVVAWTLLLALMLLVVSRIHDNYTQMPFVVNLEYHVALNKLENMFEVNPVDLENRAINGQNVSKFFVIDQSITEGDVILKGGEVELTLDTNIISRVVSPLPVVTSVPATQIPQSSRSSAVDETGSSYPMFVEMDNFHVKPLIEIQSISMDQQPKGTGIEITIIDSILINTDMQYRYNPQGTGYNVVNIDYGYSIDFSLNYPLNADEKSTLEYGGQLLDEDGKDTQKGSFFCNLFDDQHGRIIVNIAKSLEPGHYKGESFFNLKGGNFTISVEFTAQ